MTMNKILEVKNVEKEYGTRGIVTKALNGISLEIREGEFTAIMGASGSGKTTLLNMIATIDRVSGGEIILNGKDITALNEKQLTKIRREKLGFVFQDFNLLDTMNCMDNIALALTINRAPVNEVERRILGVSEALGITGILKKYPYEISGGQKQRVACARALVTEPSLLLADEPTGALDSKSARELMETFRDLNREMNATILMVTHDAFSASYAGRIFFIKDGKLFDEIRRGDMSRKEFFDRIIDVMSFLGGDLNDVI